MEIPGTARPPALTRLCILSFINQGVVFPLYLGGLVAAPFLKDMDPEALYGMADAFYAGIMEPEQLQQLHGFLDTMREHGTALMAVFTLRTVARFIGTLRMWRLKGDGFHIYTTAQLLGILLPMLIAGTAFFSLFGLIAAVLWCLLYFQRMRAVGALGSALP